MQNPGRATIIDASYRATVPVSAEVEEKYCIKYANLAFKIKFET